MSTEPGRRLAQHLIAAVLAAVALLLRKLLPIEPGVGLYPLPLSAIIVSAWMGGRTAGLLATAVSAVGIAYWFLPPFHSLHVDSNRAIGFAIFLSVALLAIEFSMARRRAECALRESEAYLAEAQKLSHTGSWALTPATRQVRYLSEECYRVLSLRRSDGLPVLGPEFVDRIPPEDRERVVALIAASIQRATDFELECRYLRPDGTMKDLYVVGHPVLDRTAKPVEFLGTLIDVSERRRAERERERLRQAQADLERVNRVSTMGEFAASIAHEIRQPIAAALTNARTCVRWLEREPPDLEEARAAAARAAQDSTRAAEIITRVRSLFQKAPPRRGLVNLNAAVSEIVSMLREQAQRHAVAIRTALEPGLPQVDGDEVALQQVLMNLVVNALDAMAAVDGPRELVIATRKDGSDCLVTVTDTGPGLPPEQRERLFEAFFTTKPHGTGMGLAISRSILDAHGGRLWAEPGPTRGAVFHFSLPAAGIS